MKIAVVGASGHFRYALDALKDHPLAGIAPGVAGEDLAPLKRALDQRGILWREFERYGDLIPLCDAAVVNTRFDRNAAVTEAFLERDIPVFCEKPMALTLKELDELKETEERSRAFAAAMFGLRYSSWFRTVQKHLPRIGRIRLIRAQKSYKLGDRPDFYACRETFGGLIPWVAIHGIDWILTLAGPDPVKRLSAFHSGGCPETAALCQFEFESGLLASVSADYLRPAGAPTHGDDRLRAVGEKGILEAVNGKVTLTGEEGEVLLPPEPEEDVFRLFLRRCAGEEAGVTFEESFRAAKIALLARDAAEGGKG